MTTHEQIEKQADEAFSAFWKRWQSMPASHLVDAGLPTSIEVWHHAWRTALGVAQEQILRDVVEHAANRSVAGALLMSDVVQIADRIRAA